jgi:PhnB protein
MKKMYIPPGYGTVFPYMIVSDMNRFVDFVKAVFDAKELGRTVRPDGRVANCRLRIGTTSFMVSAGGGDFPSIPAMHYIYVEDTDATFAKALANGAKKIMDPADMPYQDRQGGVIDPCGNTWWISTRLVEEPYD